MKISKSELKQIIKEEHRRIISERGNPALAEIRAVLRRNLVEFVDTYSMEMGMNPSDPVDRRRIQLQISDLVSSILGPAQ